MVKNDIGGEREMGRKRIGGNRAKGREVEHMRSHEPTTPHVL